MEKNKEPIKAAESIAASSKKPLKTVRSLTKEFKNRFNKEIKEKNNFAGELSVIFWVDGL